MKTPADGAGLPFFPRAQLATAAAWSPNPQNPPLYLDLPTKDGAAQPDVLAKWAANAPLAFVDQYVGNLRQYRAIAIDVGDQDGLRVDPARLHDALDSYGIANSFESYSGTHTSAVADRFQNHVLPFFARSLCFAAGLPLIDSSPRWNGRGGSSFVRAAPSWLERRSSPMQRRCGPPRPPRCAGRSGA